MEQSENEGDGEFVETSLTQLPDNEIAPEAENPVVEGEVDVAENEDLTAAAPPPPVSVEDVKVNTDLEQQEISEKEPAEKLEDIIEEYLPWILLAGLGFILMIVAVALLGSGFRPKVVVIPVPVSVSVPAYQATVRVKSVHGNRLKYIPKLNSMGTLASRSLRYKVEPKFLAIYRAAKMEVKNVLTLYFKYSGASDGNTTISGRHFTYSRSGVAVRNEDKKAIKMNHWIYMKENYTVKSLTELKKQILAAADEIDGIEIIKESFTIERIVNMTSEQAFQSLAQAGFFIRGLEGLDMSMLETLGINKPLGFGVQSEGEDGPCRGLPPPKFGTISPSACLSAKNTFVQMTCQFQCNKGYDQIGASKRVCLTSGLWSGEPAQCLPRCAPMKMLYKGMIQPESCTRKTSRVGQMCFLECPSKTHRLYFPEEEYSKVGYAGESWSMEGKAQPQYDLELWENGTESTLGKGHFETDPGLHTGPWSYYWKENVFKARGFFRECLANGQWSGAQASCKAFCPKLVIPTKSVVTPEHCTTDAVEGETCTATCEAGYIFVTGSDIVTLVCDIGGKWGKVIPSCRKSCPALGTNPNLSIITKTCEVHPHAGMTCESACDEGYLMNGDKDNECLEDGTWKNSVPTCVKACEPLPAVKSGMLISATGFCNNNEMVPDTTECQLLCDYGYVGNVNITTCATGVWSQEELNCTRACAGLSNDANGLWSPLTCNTSDHTHEDADCVLTCDAGYSTIDGNVVSCMDNGIWNRTQPVCEVTCPTPLTPPTDGGMDTESACVDGNAPVGHNCDFTCDPGFQLTGVRTISCRENGTWSGTEPTCVAEDQYAIIQHLQDRDRTICLTLTDDGQVVKRESNDPDCTSEKGLWVVANTNELQNVYSRECITLGDSTFFVMEECNVNNTDQHFESFFEYQLKIASTGMMFSSGYHTSLRPHVVMDYDEQDDETLSWTFYKHDDVDAKTTALTMKGLLETGDCLPIELPVTLTPSSCDTGTQTAATVCGLSCGAGYTLSDSAPASVTCTNGAWGITADIHCAPDSPAANCPAISNAGVNGMLVSPATCNTTTTNRGDSCTFECTDPGTYLFGPDTVTCEDSGRWSSTTPSVCQNHCSQITPLPTNSHLIVADGSSCLGKTGHGAEGGTVCPLACIQGYHLVGSPLLTCLNDGKWNDPLPVCKKLCPNIEAFIPHSIMDNCDTEQLNNKLYLENTTCSFGCESGYGGVKTTGQAKCDPERGVWLPVGEGQQLDCRAKCPKLTSLDKMLIEPEECTKSDRLAGDKCVFSCHDTYGINVPKDTMEPWQVIELTRTVRECNTDNTWSSPFVTCSKRCPPLPTIAYENSGYYSPDICSRPFSHTPGTECHLMCQGYDAVYNGATSTICQTDGTWSIALGTCAPACQAIRPGRHALVQPSQCLNGYVQAGTACEIICPEGMDRSGPELTICTNETQWMTGSRWSDGGDSARCLPRCPPVKLSLHMSVYPEDCAYRTQREGYSCGFGCEYEYSTFGASMLTCTATGAWDSPEPSCQKPCYATDIHNGRIYCEDNGVPSPFFGQQYRPGTVCYYMCNEGYVAFDENEITCKEGAWSPTPYCDVAEKVFPIMQKIGDDTKCLIAERTQHTGPSNIVGSDWVLGTLGTMGECIAAGNNVMWTWHGEVGLKHAQTGLCLEASGKKPDSQIVLRRCVKGTALQSWSCDPKYPYRFTLKDSDLSIDTSYEGLGPVIASWTHANTYWITYNFDLEATATICSNKELGVCPPLILKGFMVGPAECLFNKIPMWQQCKVQCANLTTYVGYGGNEKNQHVVECQPTGEWDGLDDISCMQHCSRLPRVIGAIYDNDKCETETHVPHGHRCEMECGPGMKLTNREDSASYLCDDGKWLGEFGLGCQIDCSDRRPDPPENGNVFCTPSSCTFVCNVGYELAQGNASVAYCSVDGEYTITGNVTCEPARQFLIQAQSTVFTTYNSTCLSAVSVAGQPRVAKQPCRPNNEFSYFQWVVGGNHSMLQNVRTGLCLSPIAMESFSYVGLFPCDELNPLQQWACHNILHPGMIGLASATNSSLDIGSIRDGMPPVVVMDESSLFTGNWHAIDAEGKELPICGYRSSGACPILDIGPYATVNPSECAEGNGVPPNMECEVKCMSGYSMINGTINNVSCSYDGRWEFGLDPCISTVGADQKCDSFELGVGLEVHPSVCGHSDSGHEMKKGSRCQFSCAPGYYIVGEEMTYCASSGTWSSPMPVCSPYCPGTLPNYGTQVKPDICESVQVPAGTLCNHTCAEGFVRWANHPNASTVECMDDGTWNGEKIHCEVGCPPLSTLGATTEAANVTAMTKRSITSYECINEWSHLGVECNFSCPGNNVTVDGSDMMTCGPNGNWVGRVPRCMSEFYCPEIELSAGVEKITYSPKLNRKAIVAGTAARIDCIEGYVPDGDHYRMCNFSGMWEGNGPTKPTCVRKCPAIVPMFGAMVSPFQCVAEDSKDGTTCTFKCADGFTLTGSTIPSQVVCNDGNWTTTSGLPKCVPKPTSTFAQLRVSDQRKDPFMITTRWPSAGCYYAPSGAMGIDIQWRSASQCSPNNNENLWLWNGTNNLYNMNGERCLQPILKMDNSYGLGVGTCKNDTDQEFLCGDPRSSNAKFNFYTINKQWSMKEYYTSYGDVDGIKMTKGNYSTGVGVELRTSSEPLLDEKFDTTICSQLCGGTFTFNEPTSQYIVSPGFLDGKNYPPNVNCEWTINAVGKIIRFEMLELDLEVDDAVKCSTDCLQVYEGNADDQWSSELLAVYSGHSIANAKPRVVATATGTMQIKFITNSKNQYAGFAASYIVEDKPSDDELCGYRYDMLVPTEQQGYYTQGSADLSARPQGEPSSIYKYPFMVSIREWFPGGSTAIHRCSGALIKDDIVISAAHCAKFADYHDGSQVVFGIGHDHQAEMDKDMTSQQTMSPRYMVYEGYDYVTRIGDVALWRLMDPLPIRPGIAAACFPHGGYRLHNPSTSCHVIGWSSLVNGMKLNHMASYKVQIVPTTQCEEVLGLTPGSGFICVESNTLDEEGMSEIYDSEPLVCRANSQLTVVGVRAYTHVGARATYRLYTDLSLMSDWIESAIDEVHIHYKPHNTHLLYGAPAPSEEEPNYNPTVFVQDPNDMVQWILRYNRVR